MSKIPGLDHLMATDRLVVKQTKDIVETILPGYEKNNKYEIFNGDAQQIYWAVEETSTLKRIFLGHARPFTLKFLTVSGEHVITLSSSTGFFTREVGVEIPPGNRVYEVKQEFALVAPDFFVRTLDKTVLYKICSPIKAAIGSFKDVNFDILESDEKTKVGHITKQWGGFFKEAFTDADTFGLTFDNPNMDVEKKAAILAALFCVDFAFYENTVQQHNSS